MISTRRALSRSALTGVLALALALAAVPDARAGGLTLGVGEPAVFAADPDETLLDKMRLAGASIARGPLFWRTVAPEGDRPPDGFDPRDPASPHYRWAQVDGFVRSTTAKGMEPLLAVYSAPVWAEGVDEADRARRRGAAGAYRPDAGHYGDFAHALARRYDGSFPDPERPGAVLPRVRYFQAWNEPNFALYLAMPKGEVAHGSRRYVRLLNAFYKGVKRVHRSNFVISAGTGPHGGKDSKQDVEPQLFIRRMFCLRRGPGGRGLVRRPRCNVPRPRLDALGHHPYTFRYRPASRGVSRDAGAIGNMPAIKRILDYAQKHALVAPRGRKDLWVTEFGWFSDPPGGFRFARPLDVHARFTSASLWRLWRHGVSTLLWYALEDKPGWPGGLLLADGTPKPAFSAFRFPFVAIPRGRRVAFWGSLQGAGRARIRIERAAGDRWRRTVLLKAGAEGIFRRAVRRTRSGRYRARVLSGPLRGTVSHPFRVARD